VPPIVTAKLILQNVNSGSGDQPSYYSMGTGRLFPKG